MKDLKETEKRKRDVDFGGLDDSIGFLIRIAQISVFEHFLEAQSKYGLKLGAVTVLILIESNPGIRHGVLARSLHIKLAHMTKLIKSLESKGLVTRSNPESDRRSVELTLTEEGKEFVGMMRPMMLDYDKTSLDGLSQQELKQLKSLLRRFVGLKDCTAGENTVVN